MVERLDEESASGREIPFLRDEDVDDLAVLVDRPVQLDQRPATLKFRRRTTDRRGHADRDGPHRSAAE
jgi:hypothetical protein